MSDSDLGGYHLEWHGEDIMRAMRVNGAKIIAEFGLTVEGASKKELRRGHGVLTGTLRRSIHTALPGYAWEGDDVAPTKRKVRKGVVIQEGSPERGGQMVIPEPGSQVTVQVGSGLKYAMAVHQGHHSFAGYHYLTNGLAKAQRKLAGIIAKYKVTK